MIFSGQNFGPKMPKLISLHDVLEPLRQALLASRDVIISSQICGSKLQKVFTLGDGCWLPIEENHQQKLDNRQVKILCRLALLGAQQALLGASPQRFAETSSVKKMNM